MNWNFDLAERVRESIRLAFMNDAEIARRRGNPHETVSCFEALAGSMGAVAPELLRAHYEMFDDLESGKIDIGLTDSIHYGSWSPASATEYIERFIAMASGTTPYVFAEPEDRP
jgi:hypothetical protein